MARSFNELLQLSAKTHGHMCPGQVLGVRMAMLGLALLGCEAPLNETDIKKIVIFVEIDRCAADALTAVTGVKLGRRSLKFKDFGLMAATFVHLPDDRAVRVAVREDCRDRAAELLPHVIDPVQREIEAYQAMRAEDIFTVESVRVELRPEELPGYRGEKALCDVCGAMIRNRREVVSHGRTLCPVCAGLAYFERLGPVEGLDALDPSRPGRV
ncbi:MAG: formylmethanofuran dehydrogenase [Proteobacteria bacterium]|nr:formylmethanofuran dehydrogenase [Pseudomonadota bacterium]